MPNPVGGNRPRFHVPSPVKIMITMQKYSNTKKLILIFFGICIFGLSLCSYVIQVSKAYPVAPDGISSTEAVTKAQDFAKIIKLDNFKPDRPITGSDQLAASWFTYKKLPPSFSKDLPIYFWEIKDLNSNCTFKISLTGYIIGVQFPLNEIKTQSLVPYEKWLNEVKSASSPSSKDDQSIQISNQDSKPIEWITETAIDKINLKSTYTVENNISNYRVALNAPSEDLTRIQRSNFYGEATSTIGFIATLILIILAIGTIIRSNKVKNHRLLTSITIILAILVLASAINSVLGTTIDAPPGLDANAYRTALLISNSFAALLLFATVKLCGEAGTVLSLPKGSTIKVNPLPAISIGYVIAGLWLMVSTYSYSYTNNLSITSVQLGPPYQFSLTTLMPVLVPLGSALIASVQEEILFRWFGIRFIATHTGSIITSIIITAITWALMHANYAIIPSYFRVVELIPLGIILGIVAVRYGILASISTHFAIDFITLSFPEFSSGNSGIRIILTLVFFLPFLVFATPFIHKIISNLNALETGYDTRYYDQSFPVKAQETVDSIKSNNFPENNKDLEEYVAINANKIQKKYGNHKALAEVTFKIDYGKITCLLGPNGAGKTTLIHILVGQEEMSAGEVTIYASAHSKEKNGRIGYIPDASMVYPLLTVKEHLRFVEKAYNLSSFTAEEESQFLHYFGLNDHGDYLASKLSKGLKKRLLLACTVRYGAQIFILDEPFDGLDPDGQYLLMNLLKDLKQDGAAIIVSTHRLDIAERINDHLLVLVKGKLAFNGIAQEFMNAANTADSSGQTLFEQAFKFVSGSNNDDFNC